MNIQDFQNYGFEKVLEAIANGKLKDGVNEAIRVTLLWRQEQDSILKNKESCLY